ATRPSNGVAESGSAGGGDVRCLRALLALLEVERDLVAFGDPGSRGEAVDVDERVLATTLDLDEAVALVVVEPLHGSVCHMGSLLGVLVPVLMRCNSVRTKP